MRPLLITGFLLSCLGLVAPASAATPQRPITNPKFDPNAPQIGMFEAIAEDAIEAKLIPKSSLEGTLLLTNKGKEPLTVHVPEGFVGVPVSAQFGGAGGGLGGGGLGGGGLGGQQGGGQQQAVGGGLGGGGLGGGGLGGGGGFGGGGGGFFSIPAERTVALKMTSVCLEHGKSEPNPRVEYKVISVEEYTQDPILRKLIVMVGTGRLETGAAQAAAWNVASGMDWNALANKQYNRVAAADVPYFSRQQLVQAQAVVAAAEYAAKTETEQPAVETPRTSRTGR